MVERRFDLRNSAFLNDQSGSATIWSLGMTIVFLLIGGLAIDAGNAYRMRQLLQLTADSAAFAGVQDLAEPETAEVVAIAYAEKNMPVAGYGNVVSAAGVQFGIWDPVSRRFTETAVSPNSIRVLAQQTVANGNPVGTFLLKLANIQEWNISAKATVQVFYRRCHENGIVAGSTVEISSENVFADEYCIHGQDGVTVGSNNVFEPGVDVSMYDFADFVLPDSGFETNDGLAAAISEDFVRPALANKAAEIAVALRDPASTYQPSFIDAYAPIHVMPKEDFDSAAMLEGRVNVVTGCVGSQFITVNSDVQNTVLATDCKIHIGGSALIVNSVLASSKNADHSVISVSDFQLGLDDNCAPGGGSQIISAGRVNLGAGTSVYGSQIVADEDILLGSVSGGIQGSSFQAGDDVVMTSDGAFAECSGNPDLIAHVTSIRLVD